MKTERLTVKALILCINLIFLTTSDIYSQESSTQKSAITVSSFLKLNTDKQATYMDKLVDYFIKKYEQKGINTGNSKFSEFSEFLESTYKGDKTTTKQRRKAMLSVWDALDMAGQTHPNESVAKMFLVHALDLQKQQNLEKD